VYLSPEAGLDLDSDQPPSQQNGGRSGQKKFSNFRVFSSVAHAIICFKLDLNLRQFTNHVRKRNNRKQFTLNLYLAELQGAGKTSQCDTALL